MAIRVLLFLVGRWVWITTAAVILAAVATTYLMLQPQSYTSAVRIIPQRARTEVNYDTRIRTLSAESTAQNGQLLLGTASAERRQALAQLVRSAAIERAVREQLADKLPPDLRTPGELGRLVEGQIVPRSEIISIVVTAPTATLAEEIAATWAQVYEQHVNELYGTSTSGALNLERELDEVRQKYQSAEGTLTNFVATVPLGEYLRQLESKHRLLRELMSVREAQVVDLHKITHRLDLLLGQAQALQHQLSSVQESSGASSSVTALTLLKAQAFASSMTLPAGLQLQLPPSPSSSFLVGSAAAPVPSGSVQPPTGAVDSKLDPAAVSRSLQEWSLPGNLQLQLPAVTATMTLAQIRADIAATIQALQDWRGRLEQEMQQHPAYTLGGPISVASEETNISQTIAQLEVELRDLQGKIAEHTARQRTIQQERDVLWESYSSVLRKVEEGRVAGLVGAGKEVSIAGQTVAASRPRGISTVAPLIGLLGAVAAAGWLLLREAIGNPFRQSLVRDDGRSVPATRASLKSDASAAR